MVKFKSYSNLLLLLVAGFLSLASMCKKENISSGNEPEYTSLIGYWKVKNGATYAIDDEGQTITTATLKEGVVAYEFFEDGKFTSHDLTGNFPSESGTWKLEVVRLDGKDIEEGTLSLTSSSIKEQAGNTFVDADGFMRFSIESINHPTDGSKPIISLTSKKFEGYPYTENWAIYVYQKL